MKSVLGLLLVYLVVFLVFVACGVVTGFVLRWALPSVDLGTGILIGVVSTGISLHFFLRLMDFFEYVNLTTDEDDELPPIRVYPVGVGRSSRKRKRK